jgi:hypothetical protein
MPGKGCADFSAMPDGLSGFSNMEVLISKIKDIGELVGIEFHCRIASI